MERERRSAHLLAEAHEREEDAYRLCLREAKRLHPGPAATRLRAIVAHSNEALDELYALARARHIRLASVPVLALDTMRRVRDAVADRFDAPNEGTLRALAAAEAGLAPVHLLHAAAASESDHELAAWCRRWIDTRERLVAVSPPPSKRMRADDAPISVHA